VGDVACPPQYLWGRDALMRNAAREREEMRELRLKARPKSHAPTLAAVPKAAE
jgi:anthraniloyl-CoA monooxygenase